MSVRNKVILGGWLLGLGSIYLICAWLTQFTVRHGVYSWRAPHLGLMLPHAPQWVRYVRVGHKTFGNLIGNDPAYISIGDCDAIFFVQIPPGKSAQCHIVFLKTQKDYNFGGTAELLGYDIGNDNAGIKALTIGDTKIRISCNSQGRIIAYEFDISTVQAQRELVK